MSKTETMLSNDLRRPVRKKTELQKHRERLARKAEARRKRRAKDEKNFRARLSRLIPLLTASSTTLTHRQRNLVRGARRRGML